MLRIAAFALAARHLSDIDDCASTDLRPAFHASYGAWMAVAHLHPGPAEVDGRALALHFWPDPKGLGWKAQQALLSGDHAALAPVVFARQSVAAGGYPALERLLYPAGALPADPCPPIPARRSWPPPTTRPDWPTIYRLNGNLSAICS